MNEKCDGCKHLFSEPGNVVDYHAGEEEAREAVVVSCRHQKWKTSTMLGMCIGEHAREIERPAWCPGFEANPNFEDFEKMANDERAAKFEAAFKARAIPTDRPAIFRIVGKMDLK